MLDKKIYVKIFIIILALLTYKILSKCSKLEKFTEEKDANGCPKDCEKKNDKGETKGTCDKASKLCDCKDGWYGKDCQVAKPDWIADYDDVIQEDENGAFNCGDEGSCLEVYYKRDIPKYWGDKKIPLIEIPKDSFFNVTRQSKWTIDRNGFAVTDLPLYDKEGMPRKDSNDEYIFQQRVDNSNTKIDENYVGNWAIKEVQYGDDGIALKDNTGNIITKDLEKRTGIPRIFKIKKSDIEDNRSNLPEDWLKQKEKIWIEDPDNTDYYLDVGNISVNRLLLPKDFEGFINGIKKEASDLEKRINMGGIKLKESDIFDAKKYAFAKLCMSKGYNYYEDEITGKPKCEFKKEHCLNFSKKEADVKPDAKGFREKYPYSEWRDNAGCIQVNEAPKVFCEGDHLCSLGKGNFKYNSENGSCRLTEEYCQAMQLTYDSERGECVEKEGQRFGEKLAGKSLSRSGGGCPPYTKYYSTYKNNNMMEQWPKSTQARITQTCMPKIGNLKDKDGKDVKCTDPDTQNNCNVGEFVKDPQNLYIEPVKRAQDSVKPWYTDDGVWPWTENPDEKKLYREGKLDCDVNSDDECSKPDSTSEIARAIGGRAGNKICHLHRCMEKRENKESCIRDAQCKDGLVCNSVRHGNLDGCGYEYRTRKSKEKCNFWPECKSRECRECKSTDCGNDSTMPDIPTFRCL